jgi:hypothetical protein
VDLRGPSRCLASTAVARPHQPATGGPPTGPPRPECRARMSPRR